MSLGHGASFVRTGLSCYYDMSNTQKSWKGAPTTNYLTYSNTFQSFAYSNLTLNATAAPDNISSAVANTFDQASANRFFIDFTAGGNGTNINT